MLDTLFEKKVLLLKIGRAVEIGILAQCAKWFTLHKYFFTRLSPKEASFFSTILVFSISQRKNLISRYIKSPVTIRFFEFWYVIYSFFFVFLNRKVIL